MIYLHIVWKRSWVPSIVFLGLDTLLHYVVSIIHYSGVLPVRYAVKYVVCQVCYLESGTFSHC